MPRQEKRSAKQRERTRTALDSSGAAGVMQLGRVETRFGNERLFVMQHPRPTSRATRAARATLDSARSRLSAPCGGSETLSDGRRWWTSKAQIEVEFYGGGDGNIGLVLGGVGS